MKPFTLRVPEDILTWLRGKAALETIKENKQVSMNTLALEILAKAMKADKKGGK
jgi:hypothetical protein